MMKNKQTIDVYACDFETTVYEGQTSTEVWSSALCKIFTEEDAIVHHSIGETLDYFVNNNNNVIAYYHNLKFDGSFWVDYLLNNGFTWVKDKKKMNDNEFSTLISDMGMWYTVNIKKGGVQIELRDSLKLVPFSLKQCCKAFKTKHQKLDMQYKGYRYSGCDISEEEMAYIKNDVYVLREVLEFMFNQGHESLTIGSCCMREYKNIIGKSYFDIQFPDMYEYKLNIEQFNAENLDEYIRKSYRGGWCYVVPGKTNRVIKNGVTADVNSLYPSMMHSESGNRYPVGMPEVWHGNYIPEIAKRKTRYYFVRFKCSFRLKPGYLPFIQIKGNPLYRATEMLTDSRPTYQGKKYNKVIVDGREYTDVVTMTMTCTDFDLFLEHYYVNDLVILDGCYFYSQVGIFDAYINKYREIKENSTGAMRTLAKLFLNNLYGKFASSRESSYQQPYIGNDGVVTYDTIREYDKKSGFIPIGSAITSYARCFTIRTAQVNYYGEDKKGFIYADTDSIHCDLKPEQLKNVPVHPTAFCHWKLESSWDYAIFLRQKTYMEHITAHDLTTVDEPYYDLKCAGMPGNCKDIFINDILTGKKTVNDFSEGLCVTGKLMPKRIKGGVVLVDTTFEIK